ncbi:hypothetical protein MC378_14675 [Polaribacter sp. MSW13]|uniref:Lipoprotein n=1 Tax=Polaribacter marinus TaxID=2916838 RepID=A0A9X1VQG4_9FLAO|nr:hypothetical protein [Polaribacter marinus]MCI2230421.1 hypothetical protein [Polaribacter marinus]
MRYVKIISVFIIILTFAGCSVKEYYFPMSELTNGKVYKYECKSEPTKTQYWKLTADLKNQILTTEAYESDFRQYELFKEKITDKGTEVIEFISYFKNEKGIIFPVKNTPKDVDVFRWKKKESYKYSSENQYDSNTKMIFSKEREYIGKVKINILGKEYEAAKFKGSYKTVIENSTEKFEYTQYSYYAKGIGLAKMEKEYSDGKKETLELTEIMTIDEWNKRQ